MFNAGLARMLFERGRRVVDVGELSSHEHFSIHLTLIEAWAHHATFAPNETHQSTIDMKARLARNKKVSESKLAHTGGVLMEGRNGQIFDVDGM